MDSEVAVLMEASRFLDSQASLVVNEPMPVFRMVTHARNHINNLLELELRREEVGDTEADHSLEQIFAADERGDNREDTEERYGN